MPHLDTNQFGNFDGFDTIVSQLPSVGNISDANDSDNSVLASASPVRSLFAATQLKGDTNFNKHIAIRTLVNYMKRTIYGGDIDFFGDSVQKIVFPGFDPNSAPASLTVGILSADVNTIGQGGCALLVKAFYNGARDCDDYINIDKANQNIANLNTFIRQQKTAVLMQYYRYVFSIQPSDALVTEYKILLLSKPYRTLKKGEVSQGWPDFNSEMFDHFSKLAACGASDATIADIYDLLIHPTDGVGAFDPGDFSAITPSTWWNYSGWLSEGLLDWTDLNAQNLDDNGVNNWLADAYCCREGYHEDGGSCFDGSSLVLMADGNFRPISNVKIGDQVATHPESKSQVAKVIFIAKPPRAGRALYAFRHLPSVKFTATHPLLSQESSSGHPVLRFVHPLEASCTNPTWRSFSCSTINPSDLIVEACDRADPDQVLYDLVFEQNITPSNASEEILALPTYVVGDGHGQSLTTLSEAPIATWLPYEVMFVQSVLEEIENSNKAISDVLQNLASGKMSLCTLLSGIAKKLTHYSHDSPTQRLLKDYLTDDEKGQMTAFFIEKLFSKLGRLPSNLVSTGWARPGPQHLSFTATTFMLHRLQVLDVDSPHRISLYSTDWHIRVWQSDRLVVDQSIQAHREGPNSVAFYHVARIDTVTEQSDDVTIPVKVELSSREKSVVLKGQGDILKACDTWINLMHFERGSPREAPLQAVIEVEIQDVRPEAFQRAKGWTSVEMEKMASAMGRAFGRALVERR